jgi:hypothetical protein
LLHFFIACCARSNALCAELLKELEDIGTQEKDTVAAPSTQTQKKKNKGGKKK